jgi:hypothetical protein
MPVFQIGASGNPAGNHKGSHNNKHFGIPTAALSPTSGQARERYHYFAKIMKIEMSAPRITTDQWHRQT